VSESRAKSIVTRPGYALLGLGIALGLGLLGIRAAALPVISHDDGISYIAATCHQLAYGPQTPQADWVPASEWQAFWTPDRLGCFRGISRGLGSRDIHPPLYFWILHLWIHVVGFGLLTGPSLNLLLYGGIAVAIFSTSRLVDCSPVASGTGAILWLLSGSSLTAANQTRQYGLLALTVVLFVSAVLRFLRDGNFWAPGSLGAFATAGLLTHYQFSLVLAAVGVWALAFLLRGGQRRRAAVLMTTLGLAVLCTVLIHPLVLKSLRAGTGRIQRSSGAPVAVGVFRCLFAWLDLIVPFQFAGSMAATLIRYWPLTIATVGLIVLLVVALARRHRWRVDVILLDTVDAVPALAGTAVGATVTGLYIFGFSPEHAMGPRYLLIASPLLFVALAQLLDRVPLPGTWSRPVLAALVAYQLICGCFSTYQYVRVSRSRANPDYLRDARPILLDTTARGILPTALWHADPDTPVYAAPQNDLLDAFPEIPEEMEGLGYVSDLTYHGNSTEKQQTIVARLETRGYEITGVERDVFGTFDVFSVSRVRQQKAELRRSGTPGGFGQTLHTPPRFPCSLP